MNFEKMKKFYKTPNTMTYVFSRTYGDYKKYFFLYGYKEYEISIEQYNELLDWSREMNMENKNEN